jgi:hypothetical protein
VTLASLESSAQTNKDDAFVAQQTQIDQENQVYIRNFISGLLQRQAAANARGTSSTQGHGTSGSVGASASLQGAKSPDGSTPNPATDGSAATSGGASGNRVDTSLVVSKSGPLVPALILALVLGFCLLTAIEVRRRSRRAAGVSDGDNGGGSSP